ncbi:hypothetical protein GND98_013255 [Clostridium butyricum]|uniref:Uncharacterized protein n=3 Tax=Clostridium butyricum TaxID=1492 RepID=A0A6L9EQ90_CLOBU|nr:hypothetical protein [Clostridium butyricum]
MNAISNNSAISNLQVGYNRNHIHGNMSKEKASHDMSKMNEVANKDQMKTDCNMQGMHQDSAVSSADKSDSGKNAVDSNLGRTIDVQV